MVAGIHRTKNGEQMTLNADRTKVPGGKPPAGASRSLLTGINERKNVFNMRPKVYSLSPKAYPGSPKAYRGAAACCLALLAGINWQKNVINEQKNGEQMTLNADRTRVPGGKVRSNVLRWRRGFPVVAHWNQPAKKRFQREPTA
jgi:hypothetical protein